jgi:hypothetical protein
VQPPFGTAFDTAWWTEQVVIWLVFSLLVSLGLFFLQLLLRHLDRRKYENWTLLTVGFDDPPQPLYWEDVRRWLSSPRELWLMVKGTVSGVCQVTPRTVDAAQKQGWVVIDRENREIRIDFTKIPPEHLKGGKFEQEPKRSSAG